MAKQLKYKTYKPLKQQITLGMLLTRHFNPEISACLHATASAISVLFIVGPSITPLYIRKRHLHVI